jgi:multiple sugar transport system substrate-binding protein/raffinose/stachyose/melibiose transport system substrate-binding protein
MAKKMKMVGVIITVLLMASIAACSGKKQEAGGTAAGSPAGNQRIELTQLIWMPDNPDIPLAVAEAFQKKYPNITVYTQMMSGSLSESVQPRAASRDMPDFLSMNGDTYGAELFGEGLLRDVSDTKSWVNMLDALKPEFTDSNGGHFGITGGLCTTLFFYNKDIFAKNGISEFPTNYQDFLAVCAKLKQAGITPIAYPGGDPNSLCNTFYSYGLAQYVIQGDQNKVNAVKAGGYNFSTPETVKMFERIKEVVDLGYVQDGYMSSDYTGTNQIFLDQDAAMIFQGTWLAGYLATPDDFEVGCALPPWNDAGETLIPVLSSETGFGIGNTGSEEKKAAAVLLMDFWNGEGFHLYQNPRGLVPGHKSETIIGDVKLAKQIADLMDYAATFSVTNPLHFVYMPPSVNSMKIIGELLLGNITPAQAAQQVTDTAK